MWTLLERSRRWRGGTKISFWFHKIFIYIYFVFDFNFTEFLLLQEVQFGKYFVRLLKSREICPDFLVRTMRLRWTGEGTKNLICRMIWIFFYSQKSNFSCQTTSVALFPIPEFVLDEMFQQNASKFAIFLAYENPCSIFHFLQLYFFLNKYPARGYLNIE